jgi:hypothetical protein
MVATFFLILFFRLMAFLNRLSLNILLIRSKFFSQRRKTFWDKKPIDQSFFALLIFDNFLEGNIEANKTGRIIVIVRSQPVDKYLDRAGK